MSTSVLDRQQAVQYKMELSSATIHDVIFPTSAFCTSDAWTTIHPSPIPNWAESTLNPKNRINSLAPPVKPAWRIDGCNAFGTQFHITPIFMDPIPVRRIDVFIPEAATLSPYLRSALDMDVAFYLRDGERINRLGIAAHLLNILQCWTELQQDPVRTYTAAPFGSRLVLNSLPKDPKAAQVIVAPTHHLERQLLSPKQLHAFWGPSIKLPPLLDLDRASHIEQLHDSVSLTRIDSQVFILKAITSHTKFLYHELYNLLSTPAHPNIISRPVHLITKKCGFGNKTAVVGFTVEFHLHGSLRDHIPFYQLHGQLCVAEQTKWSIQLASALLHHRETTGRFYPDLRLDNIVLSKTRDIVMVDFEQRGVWCEFAAPEVNALDYIKILATDEYICPEIRTKYSDLLTQLFPGWQDVECGETYRWPATPYNVPWMCLTPREQEACEVYMLGRVLWCFFEGNSAPQRASLWISYKWEPLADFPNYTRTPVDMRHLIDRCTRGRRPGLSSLVVRKRDHMVLRALEHTDKSTPQQVQAVAKEFWSQEMIESESWLARRAEGMARSDWNENYYDRPSLQEVRDALQQFYNKVCQE